jgi:hypothetical protein
MICSESYQNDNQWVVADCLRQYGHSELANQLLTSTKIGFFDQCLNIIKNEAVKRFDNNVLERLYFSGLIYNTEVAS